jgi:hypothetical protein
MPDNDSNNHDSGKQERRSGHAKRRAREGRQVAAAFRDVQRARKSDLFFEVEKQRYVVRGSKGREHIFTPEGQLVTTIDHRSQRAHIQRLESGTIRPVTDVEFTVFKDIIR